VLAPASSVLGQGHLSLGMKHHQLAFASGMRSQWMVCSMQSQTISQAKTQAQMVSDPVVAEELSSDASQENSSRMWYFAES